MNYGHYYHVYMNKQTKYKINPVFLWRLKSDVELSLLPINSILGVLFIIVMIDIISACDKCKCNIYSTQLFSLYYMQFMEY